MTYRGTVKDGVVVLEAGASLAEGVEVRVEPVKADEVVPTLGDELMRFAGSVRGMPSDISRNHDHYAHGAPRK